jgi:predicted Zn-dependent protease
LVFSRGLGAARIHDVAAARSDARRLEELRTTLVESKNTYWAKQTDAQLTTLNAWIALAELRPDEALALMRAAADAEEASDKHPVTPGNVIPLRELLGEMLLELNQPGDAQTEFARSLRRDPNRLRCVYGAARAADAAGDNDAKHMYFAKVRVGLPPVSRTHRMT